MKDTKIFSKISLAITNWGVSKPKFQWEF